MPYDELIRPDGQQTVGGVMTLPADVPMPPCWSMYFGVPKLEDTAAHIIGAGGRACSGIIDIPNVGRVQVMADPQGAMFNIFEPKPGSRDMPETLPTLGDVSWFELMTADAPAAMGFYRALFGWNEEPAVDMGPMGKYYMFSRQWPLGGMMNKPAELGQVPNSWGLYFNVADVDAAAAVVTSNGGQILNGPMDVPGGDRVVSCVDPQGAAFSLHCKKG
jgi:predicted enzyme related to lactoylglutathione lyase